MNPAPPTTQVKLKINNNIAEISFFNPKLSVNSIDWDMMSAMADLLHELKDKRSLEGLIIYSQKPKSFLAGADLQMLDHIQVAKEAEAISRQGHALIQQLEDLPFPVVAAIDGACFGGGLEMSLACTARICSDSPATRFGLPELRMGLIPGAGGTQRLPKLIGLEAALDLMLQSRELNALQAQEMGLVDEIVVAEHLLRAGREKLLSLRQSKSEKSKISDRLKFWQRLPLGKSLSDNSVGQNILLSQAREGVQKQSHGHYPAPFALLRVIETGLEQGAEAGFQAEAEAWGQLVISKESRQLRRIYALGRAAFHHSEQKHIILAPGRIALLGCGRTGSSIALYFSDKGHNIRIVERDLERIKRSLKALHRDVARQHKHDPLPIEAQRQLAKISLCTDYSGLVSRDLAIEAVADQIEDKQHALVKLENHCADDVILASSSAYLPLAMLGQKLDRRQNFVGLHFLRPMPTNKLVELVITKDTNANIVRRTQAWLQQLGKQSVVVNDGPAYYTTRSLMAYLLEALRVLEEGAAVEDIDRAMRSLGMKQGPFRLLDRLGLDQTLRIAELLQDKLPERFSVVKSLRALRNDGRFGIKNLRGFYRYAGAGQGQVDTSIYDLLTGGQRRKAIEEQQVHERLLLAWVNNAQDCLDSAVLANSDDGDLLAVSGLGFPAYLGGPFHYIEQQGRARVHDKLLRLQEQHGDRFAPAAGI